MGEWPDPPFDAIPDGVGIADYFARETEHRNNGGDGINLWRDGQDYCYLWVEAHVDHDLEQFFLLDIRTNTDGIETRDFLYVTWNIFDEKSLECEWFQHPVEFGAGFDAHIVKFIGGMRWFLERIVAKRERGYDE